MMPNIWSTLCFMLTETNAWETCVTNSVDCYVLCLLLSLNAIPVLFRINYKEDKFGLVDNWQRTFIDENIIQRDVRCRIRE